MIFDVSDKLRLAFLMFNHQGSRYTEKISKLKLRPHVVKVPYCSSCSFCPESMARHKMPSPKTEHVYCNVCCQLESKDVDLTNGNCS